MKDNDLSEFVINIDCSKVRDELNKFNSGIANIFKNINSGSTNNFLSIKQTSKNAINIDILNDIDFTPIECPHCKTKHNEKIGWLKMNRVFNCHCRVIKFVVKIID